MYFKTQQTTQNQLTWVNRNQNYSPIYKNTRYKTRHQSTRLYMGVYISMLCVVLFCVYIFLHFIAFYFLYTSERYGAFRGKPAALYLAPSLRAFRSVGFPRDVFPISRARLDRRCTCDSYIYMYVALWLLLWNEQAKDV